MVTHSTTNLPIWCLSMAERTGCPVLTSLWSYVLVQLYLQSHFILCFHMISGALQFEASGDPQLPLHALLDKLS